MKLFVPRLWASAAIITSLLLTASPIRAQQTTIPTPPIYKDAGGTTHPATVTYGINADGSPNTGGGGGGGGGAVTAASGSYVAGAIFDLGTGGSPGANTTNGILKSLLAALGSPYQAGGALSISNTAFQANAGTNLNTSLLALETGGNLAQLTTDLGPPGATACATDTGSCAINALLQRGLQRLTTINTTLGSPFQAGGSIGNTGFNVTGTLPAFAAIPAFKSDHTTPGNTDGVVPDNNLDGVLIPSNNCTGVSTCVALTATQLQGMGSAEFNFSAIATSPAFVVEASVDTATTWQSTNFQRNDTANVSAATTGNPSVNNFYCADIVGNGLRIRQTAGTGTSTVNVVLKRTACPPYGVFQVQGLNGIGATMSGQPLTIGCVFTIVPATAATTKVVATGCTSDGGAIHTSETPTVDAANALLDSHCTVACASTIVSGVHNLYGLGFNATVTGWLLLEDATSCAANGTVTPVRAFPYLTANAPAVYSWGNLPMKQFATGVAACFSTTGPYTATASTTAMIWLDYK